MEKIHYLIFLISIFMVGYGIVSYNAYKKKLTEASIVFGVVALILLITIGFLIYTKL